MPPNTSRWPLARSGEPAGRRQARGQLLSGDARSWTGKIAQLDSHWIGDGEPGFGVPARVRTRARGGAAGAGDIGPIQASRIDAVIKP